MLALIPCLLIVNTIEPGRNCCAVGVSELRKSVGIRFVCGNVFPIRGRAEVGTSLNNIGRIWGAFVSKHYSRSTVELHVRNKRRRFHAERIDIDETSARLRVVAEYRVLLALEGAGEPIVGDVHLAAQLGPGASIGAIEDGGFVSKEIHGHPQK